MFGQRPLGCCDARHVKSGNANCGPNDGQHAYVDGAGYGDGGSSAGETSGVGGGGSSGEQTAQVDLDALGDVVYLERVGGIEDGQ